MLQEAIAKSYDILVEARDNHKSVREALEGHWRPNIEVSQADKVVENVCKIPVKKRSLKDVLIMAAWMQEVPSFREFAPKLEEQELTVCCLSLRLRRLHPGEPLCRIRELPTEVFYVLSGSVGVTSANDDVFDPATLPDIIFHTETRGSTIGEASILYNSRR